MISQNSFVVVKALAFARFVKKSKKREEVPLRLAMAYPVALLGVGGLHGAALCADALTVHAVLRRPGAAAAVSVPLANFSFDTTVY